MATHMNVLARGDRVLLRDWERGDLDRVRSLVAADRPWHRTNGPYFGAPTEADMSAMAERTITGSPHEDDGVRTMLGIETGGVLVGAVTWYWESKETDWRRMGISIHDETYWGQGLATEALALWTSYLFQATDALRLDLATYSGNPGMVAVARRLGFTEEARMRKARRWAGGVHDALVFGILREEWEGDALSAR
ncbi:MAG TPA: GNAT family N-acetyltransferase [Candidatus Ruania gallistercoris]|uniref:GNAT family N-acetyltransferase n=1 Tax=Candidatus Ruania gallistercoris TaxID=2838746 RepID=A0A9D2ECP7_9MICO|nr:GNAT family N-acetyltransferase [Candidatus Ruania gallistercoris]